LWWRQRNSSKLGCGRISRVCTTDVSGYEGEYIESAYAKQIGLVDKLFTRDSCEQMASETIAHIAGNPSSAFAAAKENRIELLCSKYHENSTRKQKQFIDLWFSVEAQILLKEAAMKFEPKS
jgi:enoyl-CoA hydratase/carnithine racemase